MKAHLIALIKNAISSAPTRQQSENELIAIFNSQPSESTSILCQIFDTSESNISFTAGILIRNTVMYALTAETWPKINVSSVVKKTCYNQFKEVRNGKIAADILACVYAFEISTNMFPDYYEDMLNYVQSNTVNGLNALYCLTQSIKRLKGIMDLKCVTNCFYISMKMDDIYLLNCLQCLNEVQELLKENIKENAKEWIKVWIGLCSKDGEIARAALENITTFIKYGYDSISDHVDSLNKFVISQFDNDHDDVSVQAIDYFNAVSEIEAEEKSHSILKKVTNLVGSLFSKIKKDATFDEAIWCPLKAASSCLQNISHVFDIFSDSNIRELLSSKLISGTMVEKEEAIIALGSSIHPKYIIKTLLIPTTIVESNFTYLKKITKHVISCLDIPEIRESALFTLSKLCKANLFCIDVKDLQSLIDKNHNLLLSKKDRPVNGIWLISSISEFARENENLEEINKIICALYPKLIQPLIDIIDQKLETLEPQYQSAIFATLRSVVKLCPDYYRSFLSDSLWNFILRHLDITYNNASKCKGNKIYEIEDTLCGFMYIVYEIHLKLRTKEGEEVMRKVFISMLQANYSPFIIEEVYLCLAALCNNKSSFITHINEFLPYIFRDLNHTDHGVLLALITLIGDIVGSLQIGFLPYSNQMVHTLLELIKKPEIANDIKPQIIYLLADIVLGIGPNAELYFDAFFNIILETATINRNIDITFVDKLRNSALVLLESFFYSFSDSNILTMKQSDILNVFQNVCVDDKCGVCLKVSIRLAGEMFVRYKFNKEHWIYAFVEEYAKNTFNIDSSINVNSRSVQNVACEVYGMMKEAANEY